MTIGIESLFQAETYTAILAKMLQIAKVLGLNTESWEPGDPTLSMFDASAQIDEAKESGTIRALKAGFLGLSRGDGKTLCARYLFNEERIGASFATVEIEIINDTGEQYEFDANDITVAHDDTEVTYRNDEGDLVVPPNGSIRTMFTAETAGTAGSAGIGDITTLVSRYPGLSVTNTTVAVARDAESDAALDARCLAKWASVSPAGPKGGLHFVATKPELVNGRVVTRTRTLGNTVDGTKRFFIADDLGAVSEPTRADVEEGCETWANPHCHDLFVYSATNVTVNVSYRIWVYDTIPMLDPKILETIEKALVEAFKARPIGGDVIPPATSGAIYRGFLATVILQAIDPDPTKVKHAFRIEVLTPVTDVALTITPVSAEVARLGTVTGDIVRVKSV